VFVVRPRQDAINVVDKLDEAGRFAVARMRDVHGKIGVNVGGVAAEDDDTIGQDDGFFDIVCDDENGARGNFVIEPQLEKFAAQRFRGEHVERRERLIHKKHFRLDDESAGDADALLHTAGEFLGIGGLKTIETYGVNDAESAFVALDGNHAARFERGFDIFENSEPGKKRETLENDGDVWRAITHRRAVPKDGAGARGGESGKHAQQRGFTAAGSAEHGDDLSGIDGKIRCGDDLDAAAVGLRIEFFELARFDDRLGAGWFGVDGLRRCGGSAHKSVYYRSS